MTLYCYHRTMKHTIRMGKYTKVENAIKKAKQLMRTHWILCWIGE